jgi:hypothetical protein
MTGPLLPSNPTAAQLVDVSLVLGRRRFGALIRAALPALFVAALLELLAGALVGVPLVEPVEFVLVVAAWSVGEAMAIAACLNHLHGRPDAPSDCWAQVAPRLGAITIGYCWKWLLILVGFVLLIVPGFYMIALYFAIPTTMIAERQSLVGALRRSRQLARPGIMRLIVTLGSFELVGIVLSSMISLSLGGESWERPGAIGFLAGWVVAVAVIPFRASLMTLLYLDRRVRREGYDLELALAGC